MIETLVIFLKTSILPLGSLGVLYASIIEEVIAPIPSAAVLVTSGFLFLSGLSGVALFKVLILTIALPAALGITIGSSFVYGLGFFFGKPFFERWGKFLGVSWVHVESAREKFSRGPRDELTLGFLRAIPVIPSVVLSALSGVIRMNPISFFLATFVGSIPRSAILAFIGFKLGTFYESYAQTISHFEDSILLLCAASLMVFFLYRHRKTGGNE